MQEVKEIKYKLESNIINKLNKIRVEIENELTDNILKFWLTHTKDLENQGFYGLIFNNLEVDKKAPKSSILYFRILWTFSKAYKVFKINKYLDAAKIAYEFICKYMIDKENGGIYRLVSYDGKPLVTKKYIYDNAFAIYGLSEYYSATKEKNSLKLAQNIFKLIEQYSFDKKYNGYIDACNEDWSPSINIKLSEDDIEAEKTMNTHLHILEAYTNLLRYWKSPELNEQLENLINIIHNNIIDSQTGQFQLYFDRDWEKKSSIISPGHDIEGSWLLIESCNVSDNKDLLKKIKPVSIKMVDSVINKGIDKDGGIILEYETDNNTILSERDWWVQAEGLVGFLNTFQITGDLKYLERFFLCWNFINKFVIDKKYGEWFWQTDKNGNVNVKKEKVGPWKCPYHNSRACFEVIDRIDNILA